MLLCTYRLVSPIVTHAGQVPIVRRVQGQGHDVLARRGFQRRAHEQAVLFFVSPHSHRGVVTEEGYFGPGKTGVACEEHQQLRVGDGDRSGDAAVVGDVEHVDSSSTRVCDLR